MVGHGGSSAGSYLADTTSPIPSHCASIVATSTSRVNIYPMSFFSSIKLPSVCSCCVTCIISASASHCAKKPVTTMLTYPWKCTVLHCNHLGNTWKPLVLMTQHFDYCPSTSEGDNQSVGSSAPVVSRCFPGGYNVKLYISRGRLAWWLLAFLCCDRLTGTSMLSLKKQCVLRNNISRTGRTIFAKLNSSTKRVFR